VFCANAMLAAARKAAPHITLDFNICILPGWFIDRLVQSQTE
jgi:hypothetical protein